MSSHHYTVEDFPDYEPWDTQVRCAPCDITETVTVTWDGAEFDCPACGHRMPAA